MRGVVRQLAPFIDSRSAEVAAHYFSIILSVTFRNRYFPVSLTVTFRDQRLERGPTQHARPAFFSRGCPRIVDWQGRKADAIGIGPVHSGWTVVDGVYPTVSRLNAAAMSALV